MSEGAEKQEAPTYFANVVTVNINVDELVMEFRRILIPHKEQLKTSRPEAPIFIPPVAPEKILDIDPVARVVLTITAARALKQHLDDMLPKIEEARKTGELP